jgi:CheY-like chemotaxis protein
MQRQNPIIIVDDDADDQEVYQEVLPQVLEELSLRNPLHFYISSKEMLQYLQTSRKIPALMICALHMKNESGLQLKKILKEDPKYADLRFPFILLADLPSHEEIEKAYGLQVQGIFEKPFNLQDMHHLFYHLLSYWKLCKVPL